MCLVFAVFFFFFSSRRRHTRSLCDWSSDVCSSDLTKILAAKRAAGSGASTVIAWGREQDVLVRLAAGESIGTLLVAQTHKNQADRKSVAEGKRVDLGGRPIIKKKKHTTPHPPARPP